MCLMIMLVNLLVNNDAYIYLNSELVKKLNSRLSITTVRSC